MTAVELFTLIQSDPTALALATAGDDEGCAARCTTIAPPIPTTMPVTELSIMLSLTTENAEIVLGKIETAALTNTSVKRLLKWMQPGAPGVDFGIQKFKTLLKDVCGLTTGQVKNITDMQLVPQIITANQVGEAMRSVRNP